MKVLSVTLIIDEKNNDYNADKYGELIGDSIVEYLDVNILDGNVNLFEIGSRGFETNARL